MARSNKTRKENIIQWNCQGLFPKEEELERLMYDEDPKYICLQETHMGNRFKSDMLGNYRIVYQETRNVREKKGGTAILIRNEIRHRKIKLNTNIEATAVRVEFNGRFITLCNLYLSPSEHFSYQELDNFFQQLKSPLIIVGDFNAYSEQWGDRPANRRGKVIERIIENRNLLLLNSHQNTHFHIQAKTESAIDLSLCTRNLFVDLTWEVINDLYTSDHFPIKISSNRVEFFEEKQRWSFGRANWNKFYQQTSGIVVNEDKNINEATEIFTQSIIWSANLCIPKTKPQRKPSTPWWNEHCSIAARNKKKALRQFYSNKNDENKVNLKKHRAILRRITKHSKKVYWTNYITQINERTPTNIIWDKIRMLSGRFHKKKQAPTILKYQDSEIYDEWEMAQIFAESLEKISSTENYPSAFISYKESIEKEPLNIQETGNEEYNQEFLETELLDALTKCNSQSEDPDGLYYCMMRHLHPNAIDQLLRLFNKIWTEKTFPECWRKAVMIHIGKPEKDLSNPENYRPIAMTSCMCKLMERMVNNRLSWILEKQNKLSNSQFAYRKQRSTIEPIMKLSSYIQKALSDNENVLTIFFDIQKAFDRTWRRGILNRLKELKIEGRMAFFVKNYLQGRTFRSKVGNCISDERVQEEGTPQGSVISALLFIIAVDSVVERLPQEILETIFADDLSITIKSSTLKGVQQKAQRIMSLLERWSNETGFTFSTEKTKMILFGKRKRAQIENVKLYGRNIEQVDTHKFLGITIDSHLNWIPHLKNLKKECYKKLAILKYVTHTKWGADRTSVLKLYKAIILPKLLYASEVFATASVNELKKLEPVHNTALRIATGAFCTSPVMSLLAESGIPSLLNIIKAKNMKYFVKIKKFPYTLIDDEVLNADCVPILNTPEEQLYKLELETEKIMTQQLPVHPPWKKSSINICIRDWPYRQTTLPLELKNNFLHHRDEKHAGEIQIYTDGSKMENGTAIAATTHDTIITNRRLPREASIFTAELTAMVEAMKWIELQEKPRENDKQTGEVYTIFSDSRSALESLEDLNHPLTNILKKKNERLKKRGVRINFCWVPSHVGVLGNEFADEVARRTAGEDLTEVLDGIPFKDLSRPIAQSIQEEWQRQWNGTGNNKLKEIKPMLRKWKYSSFKERWKEVVLARIRIGHSRLTHGYLIEKEEPPKCENCDKQLTIKHIIGECPRYNLIRKQKFGTRCSFADIMSEEGDFDPDKIFEYLNEIGLLDKI